jgi:ADP-ribose pyrophosphatase
MKKVEVISHARVFDGFYKVDEGEFRFERHDGSMSPVTRRLVFERGDSAAAIVVNAGRRTVYLTEQFRYATLEKAGGWLVEVAAGAIDEGETPDQSIRREIREELGFEVEALEEVADFFVSPGSTSERIFVFCAVVSDAGRVASGGGLASEGEDIKVMEWRLDDFLARLDARELKDAKTIIAGNWLKANLEKVLSRQP